MSSRDQVEAANAALQASSVNVDYIHDGDATDQAETTPRIKSGFYVLVVAPEDVEKANAALAGVACLRSNPSEKIAGGSPPKQRSESWQELQNRGWDNQD